MLNLKRALKLLGISDTHEFLKNRGVDTPVVEHARADLQTSGDAYLMTGRTSSEDDLREDEARLKIL